VNYRRTMLWSNCDLSALRHIRAPAAPRGRPRARLAEMRIGISLVG
jgi:hypothetical protein